MVTETRTLPAEFIEALGKTYADTLTQTAGTPITTTDVSQSLVQGEFDPAETAEQFAARQAGQKQTAREFDIRKAQMAGLAPTVAGMDQLQQDAITKATGAQGLGAYQQYLTGAGTAAGDAATTLGGVPSYITAAGTGLGQAGTTLAGAQALTGTGAGTGTGSIASYMSPYQSQVIDTTLTEFDRQAAMQKQAIADQALRSGAFGGGREGVQLAEFTSGSDRNRAATQAQLLQAGYGQAQAARQADLQNISGLASQQAALASGQLGLGTAQQGLAQSQLAQGAFQQGLGGFAQQAAQQEIAGLGALGSVRQAQAQAEADATRQANQMAAYEPMQRTQQFGSGVTGLMGGYPAQTTYSPDAPGASPLSSALQIGTGLASIYGNVFK
jgi:hypothetical protein|tara:strand:- start:60 stop:1214 length:1155 start_codon:yes stop_codon:yes gene_type:complete